MNSCFKSRVQSPNGEETAGEELEILYTDDDSKQTVFFDVNCFAKNFPLTLSRFRGVMICDTRK